jgi:hypothetical protein
VVVTVKEPERIRDRMEMYGESCSRMLEKTLRDVNPEFICLSEPISDHHGPLISPASFEEFMRPVHERIVATASWNLSEARKESGRPGEEGWPPEPPR